MQLPILLLTAAFCLALGLSNVPVARSATPANAGFYMPENLVEVTFHYKTYHNLILLPVVINDTITVNLVLDTGCRNLVLFGKRFQKLFDIQEGRKVQFSGLGSGKPVLGMLSLQNKVSLHEVIGERIPVVVVPSRNVFGNDLHVDGVIGYDIFIKFEVEVNPKEKLITFRPALTASLGRSYQHVPIRIVDSRPIVDSRISMEKYIFPCNLMIDTGSSLGLLLKTTDIGKFHVWGELRDLGRGFNGVVSGFEAVARQLEMKGFSLSSLPAGIIQSPWHNYASIGMDVLKKYSIVLNYCQEYVGFRKL